MRTEHHMGVADTSRHCCVGLVLCLPVHRAAAWHSCIFHHRAVQPAGCQGVRAGLGQLLGRHLPLDHFDLCTNQPTNQPTNE